MKRNILFLGIIISMMGLFTSCGSKGELTADYIPFKLDKEDGWGLMDKDGEPLFSDEFDGEISPAFEGVFFARGEKGTYSLYKAEKKPVLISGCEDLVDAGYMTEGVIPIVKKSSRITFVDKKGKEKFTLMPHKNKEITEAGSYFLYSKTWIETEDGKRGVINSDGKVIVEPIYDRVNWYKDFIVAKKIEEGEDKTTTTTILLDNNGKEIKKFKNKSFINITGIEGTFGLVSEDDENPSIYLMDKKGEEIKKYSTKKDTPIYFADKYYIYRDEEGNYGIKSRDKDETLVRAKYDGIASIDDKTFLVVKENKWKLINIKDEEIKSFGDDFDGILPSMFFTERLFGISKEGKYTIMDLKGETISKEEYIIEDNLKSGVSSDYFNVGETVEKISNLIVKDILPKIGTGIAQYSTSSPSWYQNREGISIEVENPYKTSLSCYLYSFSDMVMYDDNYNYVYNPSATVDSFRLFVSLSKSSSLEEMKEIATAIKDSLSKNGYKIDDSVEGSYTLTNGDKSINISYSDFTVEIYGGIEKPVEEEAREVEVVVVE